MDRTLELSRQDLYEKVWSKPLTHLARDLGLSDVGLAKMCRRNNIPLPPVGYWAKLAHGHVTRKLPLPSLKAGEAEIITITLRGATQATEHSTAISAESQIQQALGHPLILHADSAPGLHHLVRETQDELREWMKLHPKLPEGERIRIHHLSVTRSSTDRALAISNLVLQTLAANDISVHRKSDLRGETYVRWCGVDVEIVVKERTKRVQGTSKSPLDRYEFHPTGALTFELANIFADCRKSWGDTARKQLEDMIDEIVSGILVSAVLKKKKDDEWAERRRLQDAEIKRRRIEQEERLKEHARVDNLFKDAQLWHACNLVREYTKAVAGRSMPSQQNVAEQAMLEEWINWANKAADSLDPLQSKEPSAGQ